MAKQLKDYTRSMIFDLASDYADFSSEYARSFFCEREQISQGTFYKILHKAIEEWIVDDKVAEKIAQKSELNAGKGAASKLGSYQSRKAYDESFEKRNNYVVSRATAKKYAQMYAYSQFKQREFRASEIMPTKFFNAVLIKAITENIISDEVVKQLRHKAESNNGVAGSMLFDNLEMQRREFKKYGKTKTQRDNELRKEQRKFAQMSMDDYEIPDEMEEYKESMKNN